MSAGLRVRAGWAARERAQGGKGAGPGGERVGRFGLLGWVAIWVLGWFGVWVLSYFYSSLLSISKHSQNYLNSN